MISDLLLQFRNTTLELGTRAQWLQLYDAAHSTKRNQTNQTNQTKRGDEGGTKRNEGMSTTPAEESPGRYPKRVRRQASSSHSSLSSSSSSSSSSSASLTAKVRGKTPTGRVLVVHANTKEYGKGAKGHKESNRHFGFSAADYVAMRDSCRPYPAYRNPLLPLPRPTYTE